MDASIGYFRPQEPAPNMQFEELAERLINLIQYFVNC